MTAAVGTICGVDVIPPVCRPCLHVVFRLFGGYPNTKMTPDVQSTCVQKTRLHYRRTGHVWKHRPRPYLDFVHSKDWVYPCAFLLGSLTASAVTQALPDPLHIGIAGPVNISLVEKTGEERTREVDERTGEVDDVPLLKLMV
jgi:hypothetical protein